MFLGNILAYSSYLLQLLDVGVYCHIKRVWRKLQNFFAATSFNNLTNEGFIQLQTF